MKAVFLIVILLKVSLLCSGLDYSVNVYENGEDGYSCFRIPAIIKAPNSDLLAFAEARKNSCSDFGDIDLVMKRSTDGGRSWSSMVIVADNDDLKVGNPAPVVDLMDKRFPGGRVFLFFNTANTSEGSARKGNGVREVWYITSTNSGKSWSEPTNITTFVHRPLATYYNPSYNFPDDWRTCALTPGHALQISGGKYKGRIFVAANHFAIKKEVDGEVEINNPHCFFSDDHGVTWKLGGTVNLNGGNESTAAELSDGSIIQNIRYSSKTDRFRALAFSRSAGEQWDTVYINMELPDPVCQGSMLNIIHEGKHYLLFSNPASQLRRENLTIKASSDDGRSWPVVFTVDNGPASYSDLVVIKRNKIGVLYEKGSAGGIYFSGFSTKDILDKNPVSLIDAI